MFPKISLQLFCYSRIFHSANLIRSSNRSLHRIFQCNSDSENSNILGSASRKCPWRNRIIARSLSGYEGDGKTTVSILNQEALEYLLIDSYSRSGFRLNNGLFVVGPMAIFPRSILQWDVGHVNDINENSLSLFYILEPKIDILVIGTAEGENVHPSVLRFMKSKHINVEVLPTYQACSTYNFLVTENRYVAGAFLPPIAMPMTAEDVVRSKAARGKQLYEMDDDY